ncbi:MAG: glycoside hydrolase family 2 TIM barrel-domain containing protein [Saonia sp.]
MKRWFAILMLIGCSASAQELIEGGLQGDKTLILTPNGILKENPLTSEVLGYKEMDGEHFDLKFAPELSQEMTWIAAFNVPYKNENTNIFFYDGWVGTSKSILTNARRRKFPNDITAKVKSNAYHIAVQREFMVENETYMLLVSPKKQKVRVELPKEIFKTNRRLEYDMEAWEAKFVHIAIPPKEHTVLMWEEEVKREILPLKEHWEFLFVKECEKGDVADWFKNNPFNGAKEITTQVQVPHVFDYPSHHDFRNYKDTLDITEMYARGTGWYHTSFLGDESWKGKHVKVNFLGANTRADVWLNGQYLGKHESGYTGFHYGITEYLKYGRENELLVRIDNRYNKDYLPHTADYNEQGGLYREVNIEIHSNAFVKDVFVKTPQVSPTEAQIDLEITVRNMGNKDVEYKVLTNIVNPYNEIMASAWQDVTLPQNGEKISYTKTFANLRDPLLWTPDSPHLYRTVISIFDVNGEMIDQRSDTFGIRFFEFHKDKGFSLNGERLKLRGVNIHQDNFKQGWAMDSVSRKRDYMLMKQMGVNFIRLSHYPHHPHSLHLADSLGMMVWEEIPVVNSVGKAGFVKNVAKMTEEMVQRDRNHPSIILWGVGNEYYREYLTDEVIDWSLKSTKAAISAVMQYDTTRPTVMAQNDLKDSKAMSLVDVQGRNKYIGWYTGGSAYRGLTEPEEFSISMEHDRKEHPEWNVIVSEYGAEGKYGYHVPPQDAVRFDHSETYQMRFHKAYWNFIEKTDWVAGSTLWNMFDFTSFAKIGNIPHINQKGMMTYDRKPKSLFYYYKSQWTDEPMVYLVSHTWTHRTGNLNEKQPIEVFSNCATVELYVNGNSVGKLANTETWQWNVALKEGYNHLKAVATKDGQTVVHTLKIHFSNTKEQFKKTKGSDSD